MTRDAVLTAWLEGARISTLARIVNEDPAGVEDALRHELRNIQQEYEPSMSPTAQSQPPSPAEAPQQGAAPAKAADSSPSPLPKNCAVAMRKSPARRAVARAVGEFTDFPVALRDPKASRMRNIWLALQDGALDFSEVEQWLGARCLHIEGDIAGDLGKYVSNGMYALRANGLVIAPEKPGGKWRIA